MACRRYKTYGKVQIEGAQDYIAGVTRCLDVIDSVPDGRKLLQQICAKAHTVSMQDTTSGNACAAQAWSAFPLMLLALKDKQVVNFKSELSVAVNKAKTGGLTLEHLARQLSTGLTPATYRSAANVVRPATKSPAPAGASPRNVMAHAVGQTALAMNLLQDLMAGNTTVNELPSGWAYELPRLLRPYLTPGRGAASKVSFNHSKTFSCEHDPAMHQRPPAVGLAHELIHALHNSSGINMALAKKNNENIEELITTGMPPYNFEGLSDNKMRTQWPSHLRLRQDY